MSRIGKQHIPVPKGVEVKIDKGLVRVKGPKGQLERPIHTSMNVVQDGSDLRVVPIAPDYESRKYWGLSRTLLNNMVLGVSQGFTKTLTLVGVGYRAQVQGRELQLTLGYSHPVVFEIPTGLEIKVEKQTTVTVSGADKEQVGQAAANIRSYRKPEPYHGKGVRYSDEVIETKVGKAAGKK